MYFDLIGGNIEAPDKDDEDDDDDHEVRDPNMQPLPDDNIPTYAQENGAHFEHQALRPN
jgi:hypothetical protein